MKKYKSVIKEDSFDYSEYLLEKLFDLDQDVDYIYDKFFKQFINNFKLKKITKIDIDNWKSKKIDSSELKTIDSKKAHLINPIIITNDLLNKNGNFYAPNNNLINISIKVNILLKYIEYKYNDKEIQKRLPDYQYEMFKRQLTEIGIKSSIYHELSHWVSDSLYNRHMKNIIDLSNKYNNKELLKLKQKDVNLTYFEIDAQVHAIKNLKRLYDFAWDKWSFEKVFLNYPALMATAKKVYDNYGKEVLNIWQRNLIKRMSRENLLGKNMKGFLDVNIFKEDIEKI
jgi:hypothetical protein